MTVRIEDARRPGRAPARSEHAVPDAADHGGRAARWSPFPRHRFVWWFSPQAALQKPKR
jgi:hypothetical protein